MMPAKRIRRLRIRILLLVLAFLSLSCGIGGSEFAGGGTGGTGISTGSISGFGSVVMNGAHFRTDDNVAPGFKTKKVLNGKDNSGRTDRDVFAVGMVVTVRHGVADNDALEIEYRDNLQGPVAKILPGVDNVLEILGQTVVVDDAAVFASLKRNDIVEVSGFVDSAGRIRAAYILPTAPSVQEFEVKGFVSESSSTGFRLGPLPDGSGTTVFVSNATGGPANRTYVQVITTDREPFDGSITAKGIEAIAARTEFPNGVVVDLEGLVTAPPSGSGNVLSFAVEGKVVQTEEATVFSGGKTAADIQRDARVLVRGTEADGVLSAVNIIIR